MDYATLSLAGVRAGLEDVAREAQAVFSGFTVGQLNWKPDAGQWSVAQCFDHLLTVNRLLFKASDDALNEAVPRTIWQRVPVLPRVLGPRLVRSQAPETARKFKAAAKAQPSASAIGADVVQRFVEQHRDALAQLQALDDSNAARAMMTSPIVPIVAYSVLDGWRLLVAHDWRHVEQARRVTQQPGFPEGAR
jgi:hypothetical protein